MEWQTGEPPKDGSRIYVRVRSGRTEYDVRLPVSWDSRKTVSGPVSGWYRDSRATGDQCRVILPVVAWRLA